MKKKAIALWVTACLLAGLLLSGCGSLTQVRNAAYASRERKMQAEGTRMEDGQTAAEEELKRSREEENGKGREEFTDEEEASVLEYPVLGGENAENQKSFDYLYKKELTASMEHDEENGKVRRKNVIVYIPKGKNSGVNGDLPGTAYADTKGVEFRLVLNPYQMEGQEAEPIADILKEYVNQVYEAEDASIYEDLEVSGIRKAGKAAASMTAEYCCHDTQKEDYSAICVTYYLKRLEPGLLVLVETSVDSGKVTDETPKLLEELEIFYGMDLEWDEAKAQKKLEDYLERTASGGLSEAVKFDFPAGWAIDESYSGDGAYIYAPGGDSDGAGCGIAIAGLAATDLVYDSIMEDGMSDEEFLKILLEDFAEDVEIKPCGETCIGETIMAEFTNWSDGEVEDCRFYMGRKDGNLFIVAAAQDQWLEMNTFEIAEDFLENGKINEEMLLMDE